MNYVPRNHGQGGARRPRQDEEPNPTLSTDGIRFGKDISPTLYSDIAEAAARSVGEQLGGRDVNKASQLRRFYDEFCMLQAKVGADGERFRAAEPFVQMLKAKVAYAKGRKKVDGNFEKLLRHVVDEVKDCATFRQAKLFMEAFMAFYKVHGPRD